MNILVLSGSPRVNGNTEIMVSTFKRGAEERRNKVAVIRAYDKKVMPCIGCERCCENGGVCVRRDDMQEIYQLIDDTDMLVIASPVYWWGFTAPIKLIIDRLYAIHRRNKKISCSALLMNSYDDDAFEASVKQYVKICEHLKWTITGIITIGGMKEKGAVKKSSKLNEVFALGKSIRP